MEVELPGGLIDNGLIERVARFHTLTGRVEQSIIETAMHLDRPAYVTAVLGNALERIGQRPADVATVSRLSVADRQYLMSRLAAMVDGEQMWLKVECGHCESLFDVELRRCELPVKEAGEGFPWATLQLHGREVQACVPTGRDQEFIAGLTEAEALRRLLEKCICRVDGRPPDEAFFGQLSEADIAALDDALDEVSPALCDRLAVTCPECEREQYTRLDHYENIGLDARFFYDEIHTLASHYHWSEADILDLPQDRRRRYLDLIGRSLPVSAGG